MNIKTMYRNGRDKKKRLFIQVNSNIARYCSIYHKNMDINEYINRKSFGHYTKQITRHVKSHHDHMKLPSST